jgi:SAM-dependent methyltransferase
MSNSQSHQYIKRHEDTLSGHLSSGAFHDARRITYKERAEFYETEYATDVDQAFLCSLVTADVHSLLEIPAGVGRNLSWLHATGRLVVVADRERAMVQQLSTRIQSRGAADSIRPVVADMCDLSLGRVFDLILVPQGAFQLLLNSQDALRALRGFRRHLAHDGRLLIDLATFQSDICGDEHIRPSYYDPSIPNGQLVAEWSRVLPAGGTLTRARIQCLQEEMLTTTFYYTFQRNEQKEHLIFVMKSRRYSSEQFLVLCHQAGLIPRHIYRNYSYDPYLSVGHRMIFLLECDHKTK